MILDEEYYPGPQTLTPGELLTAAIGISTKEAIAALDVINENLKSLAYTLSISLGDSGSR